MLATQVAAPLAGALQTALQLLQLLGSREVSMQRESHLDSPLLHSKSHFEATHFPMPFAGLGHAVPQAPQLPAETLVSTHAPEQFVVPSAHAALQLPAEQTRPAAQAAAQLPQ